MTNCAEIAQTKMNEASTFWNKRTSPVTITDENKMRNHSKQKNEVAWLPTTDKQMQKWAKNKIQVAGSRTDNKLSA